MKFVDFSPLASNALSPTRALRWMSDVGQCHVRPVVKHILGAMLVAVAVGHSAHAQTVPPGQACFYEHVDYRGKALCLGASASVLPDGWNDQASSVRLAPGMRLEMFEHINFTGTVRTLTANSTNFPNIGFNDTVSSFRLTSIGSTPTPTPTPTPPPVPTQTFTTGGITFSNNPCASEGGRCNFTGTRNVAYGASGKFAVKSLTGGTACNNSVFGDPLFGIVKACFAQVSNVSPPTPVPPTPLPPVAPVACAAQTLDWSVSSASCTASAPLSVHNAVAVLTDSVAPSLGQASFTCGNGTWRVAAAATCAVNTPAPATPVVGSTKVLRWSRPADWVGGQPTAGQDFVIQADTQVILDASPPALGKLTVNGVLTFADVDINLTAKSIDVKGSKSAFEIGSPTKPYTNKAVITLTGVRPSLNATSEHARGFEVTGGRLSLHGVSPQPVWTRINDHANAGTRSFSMKDNVNWKVGDAIIIAPSDYHGVAETEKLTVSNASGTAVNTNEPLNKFRWGKLQYVTDNGMSLTPQANFVPPASPTPTVLDQRSAVGNLTRNIIFQGADDSAWRDHGFGAHMMIMGQGTKVMVDGVEFRRVGQAGRTARYPIHWHMMSYNPDTGAELGDAVGNEIRNSTVSGSANRCIVLHGTNGVFVRNNICHDTTGHAFFLEDGSERRNTLDGNLALKTRFTTSANTIQLHEGEQSRSGPSGFWITNPDNNLRSNLSADAVGNGIWFSFPPERPLGLSKNIKIIPKHLPHGIIENNTAHSNKGHNILTDFMVFDDEGNTQDGNYTPTVDGSKDNNNRIRASFNRMTLYKGANGGYQNRVSAPDYAEWVVADNAGTSISGAGEDGKFFRGLFIGNSLNNLSPYPSQANPQSAFATYHSTFAMHSNVIVNFPFVEGKSSGAWRMDDYYTQSVERGTIMNANNRFINTHPGYRNLPPHLQADADRSRERNDGPRKGQFNEFFTFSGALWDPHGYWGAKGNYVVYDVPFLTAGGGCSWVLPEGKNGKSCNGEYYGVNVNETNFFPDRPYNFTPALDIERRDCSPNPRGTVGKDSEQCRWVIGDGRHSWKLGWMRHFSARNGGEYVVKFPPTPEIPNSDLPTWVSADIDNAHRPTDSFLMALSFDGRLTPDGLLTTRGSAKRTYNDNKNGWAPSENHKKFHKWFQITDSLARVKASDGSLIYQEKDKNLVWIKVVGGMPVPPYSPPAPNSEPSFPLETISPRMSVFLTAK